MNISPIAFKGTFCIEQKDLSNKKISKIISKQDEFNMSFEASCYTNPGKLYVHVPDQFDSKFTKLLKNLFVPHEKIQDNNFLDAEGIIERMIINLSAGAADKSLIKVDTKKLDSELKKDDEMYVGYNGTNGSGLKYDRFKNFLKTNQEIRSPIIYLRKLSSGEIETHIYDGRHRFAVLRDMGIKQIPVTIDKESLELAKEIGLV